MFVPDLEDWNRWVFAHQPEANERGGRMSTARLLASAVVAAALSLTLCAQQAPSGYHTVACLKVKPGKTSEFRPWTTEVLHKYAQGRVDSGALSTYYLLRAVYFGGSSPECDYVTIAVYPGVPPEPFGMEDMSAALKKAGLNMTAQEYIDRRDALVTLVSSNLFRNEVSAGSVPKGAYMVVNYMKTPDYEKWVNFEKRVGKAMAEQSISDGATAGWSVNGLWFPFGKDLPYQGVTVDVFPNWDAVFKEDPKFEENFKKAHPDMATSDEEMEKIRTQAVVQLYKVEDMISGTR